MFEQYDSDRRDHPRMTVIGARLAVSFSAGETLYAWARDVSQGGIYVLADHSPGLGSEVEVRLLMGGHVSKVSARGTVVRDDTGTPVSRQGVPGFAIRFMDPEDSGTALLEELIRAVLAAQPRQEEVVVPAPC
jgi:hypothetical protein